MIGQFKKSRLGQIVITSFIVASITTSVVVGLYETIRIPTLNGQLSFREDKINDLESQIKDEKDKTKMLYADIDKEKLESTKWKNSSEQSLNEIDQLSTKLRQSQAGQATLTQELNALKIGGLAKSGTATNNADSSKSSNINFEQAVLLISDQEDAAFLAVDNKITDLRLVSYFMYSQELETIRSKNPSRIEDIGPFTQNLILRIRDYYDFRLTLEQLRAFTSKEILEQYRQVLGNFDKSEPSIFLTHVRQKPELLSHLSDLTKKLKANENSAGWNTNAVSLVNGFMGLTTNSPVVAPVR